MVTFNTRFLFLFATFQNVNISRGDISMPALFCILYFCSLGRWRHVNYCKPIIHLVLVPHFPFFCLTNTQTGILLRWLKLATV